MVKIMFSVLFAAIPAVQAAALDFDGNAGGSSFSLPALELPALRPVPAAPKAAGCRPFLISLSVGGVDEAVIMERSCTPENETVWALTVEFVRNRTIAARVVSDKYPEERAQIEKRIKAMALERISPADADIIVGQVGPMLRQAAAAAPERKDALIAAAVKILKAHLARP